MDHRVERLRRRPCGSRSARWGAGTGACDIDSMPPPTPTSMSPARIAWSSMPTARMPDAQTLLIVSEETSFGIPALICAWREGIWPWPACSTWPMTTCCDLLGRDVRALERGADGDAAELGGLQGRQSAAQLADRGAGAAEDHGRRHRRSPESELSCRDPRAHAPMRRRHATTDRPAGHGRRHDRVGVFDGEGIAHDIGDGVLQALVDSRRGAARSSRTLARRRTPAASAGCSPGSASATSSTPSAPAWPPRRVVTGRASSARATLCWELPHHVDDDGRGRLRRGHAAGRLRVPRLQVRARRTGHGSSSCSSPRTTTSRERRRPRARSSRPRSTPRATCRTRPRTTSRRPRLAERAAELAAEHRRADGRVDRPRRDRRPPAWARSPPSRRAATRSRS